MVDKNPDAIRQDRDRFIGFAFASADLLLELTEDLRISWAGGAVLLLLGLDSDKVMGLPFAGFVSPLDAGLAAAAVQALKPGGRHKDLMLSLRRGDGGAAPVAVSVYQSLNPRQVLGDGRFSVAQLDGAAPLSAMIAEIGESFALEPGDLQVAETSVDFKGQSLSDSDVESILGHVLERFKAEGAGGVSAGSAEDFLRRMTAETVSRVVMMRDLIHERRLSLHYQPIVALTDRKTHHYEALLRFRTAGRRSRTSCSPSRSTPSMKWIRRPPAACWLRIILSRNRNGLPQKAPNDRRTASLDFLHG